MSRTLDDEAIRILRDNDRGGFTVPSARLYPYQWNWDSVFVALGFMTFDRDRAWRELELLLTGQWRDGMVPSILFRDDNPDYFPGPTAWQVSGERLPSTGISQPPVLATVIRQLVETGGADDLRRAGACFDALLAWHRWFHRARVPKGSPAVCTVHPWESGRDNSPDWTVGLDAMTVDPALPPYERMDIRHADPAQRPSQLDYDRYMTIVKFGRDHDWDQEVLAARGPFLMADPGIHFILLRADRDLLVLAQRLGREGAIDILQDWITHGLTATDYLWNPSLGAFAARDVRTGRFSSGVSSASALCFLAEAGSPSQRRRMLGHLERIDSQVSFMLPSWDPEASGFESQRYWCGPIWPQMNYLIASGLGNCDEHDLAERLRSDMRRLIEQSGFRECFDPTSGEGLIGQRFSWTAAVWLAWASPRGRR